MFPLSFFKAENIKLKQRIEELENELLNLSGMNKILNMEDFITNVDAILNGAQGALWIITPGVSDEYAQMIRDLGTRGVKVRIVINDRKKIRPEHQKAFDLLKTSKGVDIISSINEVGMLLILGEGFALLTGGFLDKNFLLAGKTMALFTSEKANLEILLENFNLFLPSFMR